MLAKLPRKFRKKNNITVHTFWISPCKRGTLQRPSSQGVVLVLPGQHGRRPAPQGSLTCRSTAAGRMLPGCRLRSQCVPFSATIKHALLGGVRQQALLQNGFVQLEGCCKYEGLVSSYRSAH